MFKLDYKTISRQLINRPLQGVVRAYQLLVSPWIPPRCRFYPSCSQYALEALKELSTFRAVRIILWRLVKCHPFHSGGFDPVPKRRK